MPAFLQDITPFRGDGGRNESGQSLEEFLVDYRHEDYECPSVTADILVFCMKQNREPVPENLKLLMVKRRNHPCIHSWALPGGFLEIREDAAAAAARELEEETGLTGIPIEQLGCYANYDRDPRWRLVTISFLALLEPGFHNVAAGDDAADAVWMDVDCHRETERTDNQRQYTGYRLVLSNEERQIRIGALVEIGENQRGYIRERTLTVCENEGIAFDHAKFITEAVLTLLSRIEKNG